MKRASKLYTALIFLFLFAPIAILLLFSFNETKSLSVFSGFSLKWYRELFRDGDTLESLKHPDPGLLLLGDRHGHGHRRRGGH